MNHTLHTPAALPAAPSPARYLRVLDLQRRAFERRHHRALARQLGALLKQWHSSNPALRAL